MRGCSLWQHWAREGSLLEELLPSLPQNYLYPSACGLMFFRGGRSCLTPCQPAGESLGGGIVAPDVRTCGRNAACHLNSKAIPGSRRRSPAFCRHMETATAAPRAGPHAPADMQGARGVSLRTRWNLLPCAVYRTWACRIRSPRSERRNLIPYHCTWVPLPPSASRSITRSPCGDPLGGWNYYALPLPQPCDTTIPPLCRWAGSTWAGHIGWASAYAPYNATASASF